ncbi:DUF4935 domain-containing protein [Pseudarthrobacter phenanthrenivorans]|uniref:PIN domain-containing protein n=1 Tax=Pseudarthrobacter phenanthrenivorans TaxID=361575 RepID=UPI0011260298|nr:PIN domain-containing protein [Pseudarthrobacter phenanthrenivorans]TPV48006.1 DUF4935 domain-containing protein [Pseudarthrobacter phenanthrenivorans]
MIVIIPDTNLVRNSPFLSRAEWKSLGDHREDWRVKLLIPEVVLMEAVNVVARLWKEQQGVLGKAKVGDLGLQGDVDSLIESIQQRIDDYEERLRSRLSELGADLVSTPNVDHLEIARRASAGVAPYQGKTKDGYRDTLIWLTVLDIAKNRPNDEVWFVSDNAQDFGDSGAKKAGAEVGGTECPKPFHQELQEELISLGLQNRVKYSPSLQVLEQHIAALNGPISIQELARLTSSVDFEALNGILELLPQGAKVVPSEVALSPNVVEAFLHQLTTQDGPWEFTDAARRGEGRWTANYSVEAEAEIITFTSAGTSAVVTKPVRLSGFVNIKEPSEVEMVEMTSMTALPDDPDRALWETPPAYLSGFDVFQGSQIVGDMLKSFGHLSVADMLKTTSGLQAGQQYMQDMMRSAGSLQAGQTVADMMRSAGSLQAGQTVADMMRSAGSLQAGQTVADMMRSAGSLQAGQQTVANMMKSAGGFQTQHQVIGVEDPKEENDERDTPGPEAADKDES